jgi:hypothetical protein
METFLYNTQTNERIGPTREGYFLVDGIRPQLDYPVVEIEIVYPETPLYDPSTQTIDYQEYLDIPNLQYVKGYVVRNLTQEEINSINQQPLVYVPDTCTPRQFRLGLLDYGIDPDSITNMILSIEDEVERKRVLITWEYAIIIEKNNPLITQFAQQLNVSQEGIDEIFRLGNLYL